jgi:DNA mismatch endonuclease (patch repair protein)
MADPPKPSSERVRQQMAAQRTSGTGPELALRSALHRRGLRYRVQRRPIPGVRATADIVFTHAKVAVFVDGCFWHGCPVHATTPKANAAWWAKKLATNQARDRRTDETLRSAGWTVVRVWECEAPTAGAEKVANALAPTPSDGTTA